MTRTLLGILVLAAGAFLTACGGSGPAPSVPGALTEATTIDADQQVPWAPVVPLLANGQQSDDLMVWLSSEPAPPVQGDLKLDAYVTTREGRPVAGATISYDVDMTNMSHGPYVVPASAAEDGRYVGQVHLLMPGPWRVITIIERSDHPTIRLRFEFRAGTP